MNKTILKYLFAFIASSLWLSDSSAYDLVEIRNYTNHEAIVKVTYSGCPADENVIVPAGKLDKFNKELFVPGFWRADSRGAFNWCLVTGITAADNKLGDYNAMLEQARSQTIIKINNDGVKQEIPVNQTTQGNLGTDSSINDNQFSSNFGGTLSVAPYDSSGTGYSKFEIKAYGAGYRIFSKDEYINVTDTTSEKSPGFMFINDTDFPIAYSLDQVGCLYHDVIPPKVDGVQGRRKVNTPSVWYGLSFHVQADGIDPIEDGKCVEVAAQFVGELVLDVAITAVTGGGLSYLTVLKESIKEVGLKTAFKLALAKSADFIAQKSFLKLGTSLVNFGSNRTLKNFAKLSLDSLETLAYKMVINAEGGTLIEGKVGMTLPLKETKKIIDGILESNEFKDSVFKPGDGGLDWRTEMAGGGAGFKPVKMWGQYAGYAWPFRCDKMPTYTISGGPSFDEETGHLMSHPLKVKKINDCGNDMMLASPTFKTVPTENYIGDDKNMMIGYAVSIDCNHSDWDGSGSQDEITIDFYSDNKNFATHKFTPNKGNCDDGITDLDFVIEIPPEAKSQTELTHFIIDTNGVDTFFADNIKISKWHGKIECNGGLIGIAARAGPYSRYINWCSDDKKEEIKVFGAEDGSGYCFNINELVPSNWENSSLRQDGCWKTRRFNLTGSEGTVGIKNPNPTAIKIATMDAVYTTYESFKDKMAAVYKNESTDGTRVLSVHYGHLNNPNNYLGEIMFIPGSNVWVEFMLGKNEVRLFKPIAATNNLITLADGQNMLLINLASKTVSYKPSGGNISAIYSIAKSFGP